MQNDMRVDGSRKDARALSRRQRLCIAFALVAAGSASVGLGLFVLDGSLAVADPPPGETVHEFVPERPTDARSRGAPSGDRPSPSTPSAEQPLPEPELVENVEPDERAVLPPDGSGEGIRPFDSFRPDRNTELDGLLDYYEVFTPAISPFKRITALDAVEADYRLVVSDRRLTPVAVVGQDAPAPDARPRDVFWGSVVVELSRGGPTALPSVSPESRILSYRTTPRATLRFFRDGADNFFVSGDAPGRVRVVFLTDAPRAYFGTPIRDDVRTDLYRADARVLPPLVAERAAIVAGRLGVSSDAPLRQTLDRLVGHFRSFVESAEPPPPSTDIYVDLALGRKGVCRHRAFAFMVTANALGIPTRMVQNEAHAWVEVRLPAVLANGATVVGWVRIDLGGAAEGLQNHNADDRPAYQPDVVDTLPQPAPYEQAYSRIESDTAGGSGAATSSGTQPGAVGDTEARPTTDPNERPGGEPPPDGTAPAPAEPPPPEGTEPRVDDRVQLSIEVRSIGSEVFRGRMLRVTGNVRGPQDAADVLGGLRIEISLVDEHGSNVRLLGVTTTGPDGSFAADATVPPELPVGDYTILAATPGDERRRPAQSQ
ncbi:MAG: transglutaminase domain-containing protein [Deltaproteobacteria bacterium]|nr:transglutaminase domain-containing protein [Deltaproteobacteria bacterium]